MKADKRLAKILAAECHRRMGNDIQLLDVRKTCDYCNHVLMVSGKNRMHLDALTSHLRDVITEKGASCYGIDGKPDSGWIIMDLGAIVIHLFLPEIRDFYDLPGLWSNARKVDLELPRE